MKSILALALILSSTAPAFATSTQLPSTQSIAGTYQWDLLAPIRNGRSPYSRNCAVSIRPSSDAQSLSFEIADTDAGQETVKSQFQVSLKDLNTAESSDNQWQIANNPSYDGSYLPVTVSSGQGPGSKSMSIAFINGSISSVSITRVISTGVFNESSESIVCAKPIEQSK